VGAGVTAQVPPEMALIASGAFRVNTTLVSLGPYAIDRHEVTAADYARCVAAGRCVAAPDPFGQTVDRATAPVVNVSWEMARRYCAWAGKRLPTEAEWEFAARGIDGRRYPWGERVPQCSLARFAGCGDARLRVGALPTGRSAFGLWDMAGNVAEWVADRMGSRGITGDRTVYDPTGPNSGAQRVVRGGSFVSNPGELENGARRGYDPREGRFDVGFRCARGL
jgi:formylglycine-generating enzyme required for sulfatase activity